MVVYSGYVATPANEVHSTSLKPRLEVRLLEACHHGGTLVNTETKLVDVASSGAYSVDLIPSEQLRSRSGALALYEVAESWLGEGGQPVKRSEWGTFYLRASGGSLSDHAQFPARVGAVFVQEADPATQGAVARNSIWLRPSTGQIRRMD
ncbi:hypothetical protein C7K25_15695 [Gulosibacter molinativorax]|uniref:Uncharacterized protein n=1 Tax=Gulosibacter molinativorax TaxID=256821 RepID=A0ABT7CDT2_9MICO|nr:hypothetical protein [Gulosibacter molinativorax]